MTASWERHSPAVGKGQQFECKQDVHQAESSPLHGPHCIFGGSWCWSKLAGGHQWHVSPHGQAGSPETWWTMYRNVPLTKLTWSGPARGGQEGKQIVCEDKAHERCLENVKQGFKPVTSPQGFWSIKEDCLAMCYINGWSWRMLTSRWPPSGICVKNPHTGRS